jgi:hypothetical protein
MKQSEIRVATVRNKAAQRPVDVQASGSEATEKDEWKATSFLVFAFWIRHIKMVILGQRHGLQK